MPEYNEFLDYLEIDGVDVSHLIRDVELTRTLETADVTAGSGVTHRKRRAALADHEISITFINDTDFEAVLRPLIVPGEHVVVWGPQGRATGLPKHEQAFIFTELSNAANYEQTDVRTFPVSGSAAAAPVADRFAGATF